MQKTRKAKEQRSVLNCENELFEQSRSDPGKSTGSFNQLGGFYVNGKPLNLKLRLHIIHLATMGMRACDISKYLKVSHGCVSKIITRYKETGSVNPGFIGGSKPKVATPEVVSKVADYRTKFPGIFGWEIRGKLIDDKICESKNIPSISSINRIVRTLENRDNTLLSELDPTLSTQSFSSFQEHEFSSAISPPHRPIEHQFQSPKYSHHQIPEDYLPAPHKSDTPKFSSSVTHYTPDTASRNKSQKFAQSKLEDLKPPCKYSAFMITPHRGANTPTAQHISPEKLCPDSSSNSSVEANWSNSTQESGVWSDMSDSITFPTPVSSYRVAPAHKRKLSFSGLTDPSQPPAKRAIKTSPSKLNSALTHSSKNARKRARKTAEEGPVAKSDKRTQGGYRSQVQVKQESQLAHTSYSGLHTRGYSLASPPQLSQNSHLYPSPSRHLMSVPDPVPLDSSSLLYPCSSLGDTAPSWSHTDLLPSLYNTPSPPNFNIDMGYSSNSNFSQSSSKIDTGLSGHTHPGYFYSQMGQSQDTDSLWSVVGTNSCYESVSPLSLSRSPPYLSACTRYPSPDSTSATGPHPFYAPARLPGSLFQQRRAQEEMLRIGALSSQSISDLLEVASHPLPAASLEELTEIAGTVQQNMSLCPLLFPDVDSNSISPPTNSPANNQVLNDHPLPPTCSYLPTDSIQTGPTNSFYKSEATDIPHYYSGNLDDAVFKN